MLRSLSKSSMNIKQIYSIDGNIASGKSMILDHLAASTKYQNTHCMQEPVAEWSNMKSGADLLGAFYSDKQRWSFCFENLVQLSRLKAHYQSLKLVHSQPFYQHKERKAKIFLERSIYSSFNVFTENTYQDNGMNDVEFDILKSYYKFFTSDLNKIYGYQDKKISTKNSETIHLPFKLIYIRSDPLICFERLKIRDRHSENLINDEYLKSIHSKYEDWVSKINKDCVVIVDGNQSKENVLQQIDELVFAQ